MKNNDKINFVIAREGEDGYLCAYSFAGEVKHNTLKAARGYQKYANAQDNNKKYNIYSLVKIDS